MGDKLTLCCLAHTGVFSIELSLGSLPQLDHWTQSSNHGENHQFCGLTVDRMLQN